MRCSPTVNIVRLKPFFELTGAAPAPGPISDEGQEGEHEVEMLLNRRLVRGVMRYLVRRRGHTLADNEWLQAEELTHCQEKVAEYDTTAPRRRAGRWAAPAAAPTAALPAPPAPAPAPLVAPAGFPARCLVRGPGGDCRRRPDGTLCLNPTLSGCGSVSFSRSSDVRPVNASPDPASSARAITNGQWKMI